MGNKMNPSRLKMIIKEEVAKSLFEAAPVASAPPAVPSPVAKVTLDETSFAMQRQLQSEQPLPVDFKNAKKRVHDLWSFVYSIKRMVTRYPGKAGTPIDEPTLNASLDTQRADIEKFWSARYMVLSQYVESGDSLIGLFNFLGLGVTPGAQNFLDNGALSSVTGDLKQKIRTLLSKDNKERELLINLLTILGYGGGPLLAKKELQNLSADVYLRYIFDIYNISIVPLAEIINPLKNKVVANTSADKSTPPPAPAQTQTAAQTQKSADPSSKKSNATNWDQYVKMTPDGAAVKSAWEAYAATGQVKPDYYSFVNWYKKSKSARPDLWDDGPGHIVRLLQAKANLFSAPAVAPTPSITPGSAAAPTPKP